MVSGFWGLRACCFRFSHTAAIPLPIHSSALSFRRRLFVTNCSASVAGKKEKVIVISGPTGAGKSRLALELAKRLNGEIISADSVQVYRGLDVGSAKPSLSERKGSTIADLSVSITRVENYQLPPEAPPLTPVRN